ncbi:MAG: carboxypeptidase regulatory-like domain-containing protein [Ignavibacteriaceae bacterium]|nr:carboxypeptidase regulatory-like domain-containing protein [Ignavibacteriaceae bacterium]
MQFSYKQFFLLRTIALLFSISFLLPAQTFITQPPKGYTPGKAKPELKLFYAPNDSIILEWNKTLSTGANLKVGTSSGVYTFAATPTTGKRKAFKSNTAPLNLPIGRYYGIITNSTQNTLSGIRSNAASNPAIDYSNEIQFVVESQTAPNPTAPRGSITSSTPTFSWEPIAGVTSYWLIVSSTPFLVRTDSLGNISVQGANIVWDYIASTNSAVYGQVSPSSPFTQSAIPLIPGEDYYYTILNVYDQGNVAYASTVFGGVVSFNYQASTVIQAPVLTAPANNSTIFGTSTVRFQWDPVPNANSYTVFLFNRVTQFAGSNQEIDVPIWNGNTTNTLIDFPARTNLLRGKYAWFVIPNSTTGSGNASVTRVFNYQIAMSKFRVEAKTSLDNTNLLNFEVVINSTSGGFSPFSPYIVSNSQSLSDSIPSDVYLFTGRKTGYVDSTITVTLSGSAITPVTLVLRPLPSTVTGVVQNQANATVSGATVSFTNNLNGAVKTISSSNSGNFSINLERGSYNVFANKAGFIASTPFNLNVDTGQVILSSALKLTADNAYVSGKVLNDENAAVQLATVKATKGNLVQQVATDGSGNFSFNLSSGQWVVEVSKSGFISPTPRTFNLATGDNLTNQNFTVVPRANQVTGFVYRTVTGTGGQTNQVPVQGATVKATPTTGQVVTATTGTNGQYSLSLKNGSFTITAELAGYTVNSATQLTLTVAQTVSGVDFILNPNPSSVSGVITEPGGALIGGAVVTVQGAGSATSLSNGTFILSLPAGTHILRATKTGYVTPQPVTINLNAGQQLNGINFQMAANAGVMSGTVTSLGQPLAGANVTATNGTSTVTVVSDNNGAYTLSVQAGRWAKSASKSGFISSATDTINIAPGQVSANNNFNLVQNTAVVQGNVNAGGQPLSAATVLIRETNNPSAQSTTVTNVNGGYSVTVEAGKAYTMVISKTGYSTVTSNRGVLAASSTTIANFTLAAQPASITGRVINNLQQALSGTVVRLINATTRVTVDSTTTSLNGNYTLGATAGSYKILVSKPGHTRDSLAVTLSLGQALSNANFTLNENFGIVTGTITASDGGNVSDVVVNLTSSAGGLTILSNTSGVYTAQRLIGSTYSISFSKTGFKDTTIAGIVLNDGQSRIQNLVMTRLTGKIQGSVTASGSAIQGASVLVTAASGQTFNAETNASGTYEVPGLNTGSYTVKATKSGYRSSQVNNVTLTLSSLTVTSNITDLQPNNLVISGVIRDAANNTVLNANISVSGSEGSGAAVTNTYGSYSVGGLAPGNYTVTASKTGYITTSTLVNLTNNLSVPITLPAGSSKIIGRVTDQTGGALGFTATVKAVSASNLYETTTDASGTYRINDVSPGNNYSVFTEIFREGYTNDSMTVSLPVGTDSFTNANLSVFVANANLNGSTGTAGATVSLTNTTTGNVINSSSSSTGAYSFSFLPAGTYTVEPSKQGFTFTPANRNITLALNQTLSADFTAQVNAGSAVITLVDSSTKAPVEAVLVNMVSSDGVTILSEQSNSSGEVRFTDIPAKQYSITPSRSGFSFTPVSANVTITNGGTSNARFSVLANNSTVSGKIKANNGGVITSLPDATVTIRITESGRQYTAQTDANGDYIIRNLSAGSCVLIASKSGYVPDTLTFTLSQGQSLGNRDATLDKSSAIASGFVFSGTTGVQGITVTATSSETFSATTAANGSYSFSNLPVSPSAADTTIYLVNMTGTGITSQSKVLKLLSTSIGQTVKIDTFRLPTGQVTVNITDGTNPLDNVDLIFTRPNGTSTRFITTSTGRFRSENTLPAGRYEISLKKSGYLMPDASVTQINLPADNSQVTRDVRLRYSYTPVTEVAADQAFSITVNVNGSTSNLQGTVLYKNTNAIAFTSVAMTVSSGKLTASIPAQLNLSEVTYYITVRETSNNVTYTSQEYSFTPTAAGILSTIKIDPALNNAVLRKNDLYDLRLLVRDGVNASLLGKFTGASAQGKVKWEVDDVSALEISYPVAGDSTQLRIKPTKEGTYKLTVSASYLGVTLKNTFDITDTDAPLKTLAVNSLEDKLNNRAGGIQFSLSALDTSSKTVFLGNSLQWSITPPQAGTITNSGFFTPVDSTYIGNVAVKASDASSKISGNFDLSVYAEVNPNTNIVLTNKQGMNFTISPNSVNSTIKLTLAKQQFGPGKKNYNPVGSENSFVASDIQYYFIYEGDVSLKGDSLLKTAILEAPYDNSLSLFEGPRVLGFYNFESNTWDVVPGVTSGSTGLTFNSLRRLGQYAVLVANEPLGIKYLSVLPSPFSPDVAPMKIAYFLNSTKPPVSVTIRIFNIRGELVRTLIQNDLQYPGKYGSRTGIREISWDGLTDDGLMARNGRYVLQITAKDPTGEVSELKQVVLIK